MEQTFDKMRFLTFLLILWVGIGVIDVFAEIYKWVDEEGVIYFTDDFRKIPERYREKSEEVTLFPPTPPKVETPATPQPPSPPNEEKVDVQGHGRKWWQKQIKEWEQKRDRATVKIEELNREARNLEFRNIGLSQRLAEQNRIRKKIHPIEQEREEAERMLNEILPEEARKAGAPPGWLRESRK